MPIGVYVCVCFVVSSGHRMESINGKRKSMKRNVYILLKLRLWNNQKSFHFLVNIENFPSLNSLNLVYVP